MPARNPKRHRNRVAPQVWIPDHPTVDELASRERRIQAVQTAIARLSPLEQLIVRRVHFEGATLEQVADEAVSDIPSILNHHRRALKRLRKLLRAFAAAEFHIAPPQAPCVICRSVHRQEIDRLLYRRLPANSYRDVMREIRSRYDVVIVSAMTIVGHLKYHS